MIILDHEYTIFFTVEVAGVATAADSTPTAVLYRNGSATLVSVTVAATAVTGLYKATFTTDAGWSKTDVLHLTASATIDSTSGYVGVVWDSTGDVDAVMRGTDGAASQASVDVIDGIVDDILANIGTPEGDSIADDIANISSGGGSATIEKQEEILAAIEGAEVIQVASPNVQGNLVLTQGDTYDGIGNALARWNVTTDYTDGWTVNFTIRNENDEVVYTTTGTVTSATVISVSIVTPTGLTMAGCPGYWQGKYDVQLTKGESVQTIAIGKVFINEDQTR
jgi:hypothetical protein